MLAILRKFPVSFPVIVRHMVVFCMYVHSALYKFLTGCCVKTIGILQIRMQSEIKNANDIYI